MDRGAARQTDGLTSLLGLLRPTTQGIRGVQQKILSPVIHFLELGLAPFRVLTTKATRRLAVHRSMDFAGWAAFSVFLVCSGTMS
jgi:hypothetical protein